MLHGSSTLPPLSAPAPSPVGYDEPLSSYGDDGRSTVPRLGNDLDVAPYVSGGENNRHRSDPIPAHREAESRSQASGTVAACKLTRDARPQGWRSAAA